MLLKVAFVVLVVAIAASGLHYLCRVEYPVHERGCILITGASSGIGKAAASALAQRGYIIYAGVRKIENSDKAEQNYSSGGVIRPLILDVTRSMDIDEAIKVMSACELPVIGVVNNAGVPAKNSLETIPLADVRQSFDVNFFGALELTQKIIPLLRKSQGRIINIGSVSGIVTIPFSCTYSATKYALEAMSDAFRLELAPWKISVSMVNPGYVTTEIRSKTRSKLKDHSEHEKALYGSTIKKLQAKEAKLLKPGSQSPCCESTDAAILHAMTNPYPLTRYYPAVVAKNVPAWAAEKFIKLISITPDLERLGDFLKSKF